MTANNCNKIIKSWQCIWLFIFLTILSSCDDKKVVSSIIASKEINNPQKQIAFINYGTDPNAEKWYEYDEKGDLIRQGMSVDTIVFEYSDNQIVKRHLDKKNSWQSKISYTKDQNGRIIKSRCYDENEKEISNNAFIYDAEGYLVKNKEVVLSSSSKYTNEYIYEADNLSEVKSYNSSGVLTSRYVYTYYPDMPNILNLFMHQISDDIFPNERLGTKNKNMIRQYSNIGVAGDTLSLLRYDYIDQDKKDILVQKQNDVLNEFETVITYHFKKP